MAKKVNKIYEIHTGTKQRMDYAFGWGNLQKLSVYRESHPSVMKNRITAMNWTVNQGNEPEFMRLHVSYIPDDIMVRYNLEEKVVDGFV